MGTLSSVDISKLTNPLYTPGKLRDSLKPLRMEADKLEEKYGVEIIKLNLSILDAGNAIGKKAGVFALTDEGFTKAVKELNRNIEI